MPPGAPPGSIRLLAEKILPSALCRILQESPRFDHRRLLVVLEYRNQRNRILLRLRKPAPEPKLEIRRKPARAPKRHDDDIRRRRLHRRRPSKQRAKQFHIPKLHLKLVTPSHLPRNPARQQPPSPRRKVIVMQNDNVKHSWGRRFLIARGGGFNGGGFHGTTTLPYPHPPRNQGRPGPHIKQYT